MARLIKEEIIKFKKNLIGKSDLLKLKEQLKSSYILEMESTFDRMLEIGSSELLTGDALTLEEVLNKINKVSLDDIKRVTEKIFDSSKFNIAYVGNISNIEDTNAKLKEIFLVEVINIMRIKVVNKSNFPLPSYKTIGAAGMDLYANIDQPIVLKPLDRVLIPTGLYISVPEGYEAQIRARSGMALKHGITLANGIGTIDSDYRGEVGVILVNLSNEEYVINKGDRIAQLVIAKYEKIEFEEVDFWMKQKEVLVDLVILVIKFIYDFIIIDNNI